MTCIILLFLEKVGGLRGRALAVRFPEAGLLRAAELGRARMGSRMHSGKIGLEQKRAQ